jgi:hypothetical protein
MKTIVLIISVICYIYTYGQTYSDITYEVGTSVEVQNGADVCANNIYINGIYSGGGTICTGALPVSLSSFSASVNKRNVTLMWVTEWELNNSGFDIERRQILSENIFSDWQKISFTEGHGTSNISNRYIYIDSKQKAGIYQYRLKQIDYSGSYEYYFLEQDVSISLPENFSLSQNYPNPSNPNSKINFELPVKGKVTLKVYDILGKEVKTILNDILEANYYSVDFDGSNLASGVYFYRLDAAGDGQHFSRTVKLILVK